MKGAERPHSHTLLMEVGGGGVPGIFLGQKFWPKGKFACMNDAGIFLGCEKKHNNKCNSVSVGYFGVHCVDIKY